MVSSAIQFLLAAVDVRIRAGKLTGIRQDIVVKLETDAVGITNQGELITAAIVRFTLSTGMAEIEFHIQVVADVPIGIQANRQRISQAVKLLRVHVGGQTHFLIQVNDSAVRIHHRAFGAAKTSDIRRGKPVAVGRSICFDVKIGIERVSGQFQIVGRSILQHQVGVGAATLFKRHFMIVVPR